MAPPGFGQLDGLKAQATKWEDAHRSPCPNGVYPMLPRGPTTQEKFGSRPREEVHRRTSRTCTVTKAFFLEDIQFRGAISDFHPMKALIEKYPEDSLQLVCGTRRSGTARTTSWCTTSEGEGRRPGRHVRHPRQRRRRRRRPEAAAPTAAAAVAAAVTTKRSRRSRRPRLSPRRRKRRRRQRQRRRRQRRRRRRR